MTVTIKAESYIGNTLTVPHYSTFGNSPALLLIWMIKICFKKINHLTRLLYYNITSYNIIINIKNSYELLGVTVSFDCEKCCINQSNIVIKFNIKLSC